VIEVVTTAPKSAVAVSSTIMYGHFDQPHHWVGHLNVLRGIQDQTGGFTEFVPCRSCTRARPLYLPAAPRRGDASRQRARPTLLRRIMLHGGSPTSRPAGSSYGVERTR